jgi:hypothetical protein
LVPVRETVVDPLPPTPDDGAESGPVVSVDSVQFQPWYTVGAASIAWTNGDCGDSRGVLYRDTETVGLGVRGAPTEDGWRTTVSLSEDAFADLAAAVDEWREEFPAGVLVGEDPATGGRTHPAAAPVDADAASEVVPVRLPAWGENGKTAYVQAWRPRHAGSVYTAVRVGDFVDRYGTFADGVAYFDRLPPELHLGVREYENRIAAAVDELR